MKALQNFLAVIVGVAFLASISPAQNGGKRPGLNQRLSEARAEVITAASSYKESLIKLIGLLETDVAQATERVATLKDLFDREIVARVEVEKAEHALALAKANLEEKRRQVDDTDHLIAEVQASEQLDRIVVARGGYISTLSLIRFNGTASWALTEVSRIEAFFSGKFGRSLPVSAIGQSSVHNRLGFDHRNAVDIALHPDSAEGRALMDYLRAAGIPFIAFRHPVPGASTGPHIHVGHPSRRLIVR